MTTELWKVLQGHYRKEERRSVWQRWLWLGPLVLNGGSYCVNRSDSPVLKTGWAYFVLIVFVGSACAFIYAEWFRQPPSRSLLGVVISHRLRLTTGLAGLAITSLLALALVRVGF